MKITKKIKGLLIVGVCAVAIAGLAFEAVVVKADFSIDPPGGIFVPFTLTK